MILLIWLKERKQNRFSVSKNLVVIKNLFKVECSYINKKYKIIISFYDEEQTITLCFNNYDEQCMVFDLIKNSLKNKEDILDLDEILNK